MNSTFLKDFLLISDLKTLLMLGLLLVSILIIGRMSAKKVSFSTRVIVGMLFGLGLGILIQALTGFSDNPRDIAFVGEITTWFSLLGNGYMSLIRMLVVPLVMVSIIHVFINIDDNVQVGKLVRNTIVITLSMVAVATIIGLIVGNIFKLGVGGVLDGGESQIKEVSNLATTLRNLIPSNPVKAMVDENIIGLVIFSLLFAIAAKRMSKRHGEVIKPFFDLINSLHKIIISVAMSIIRFMPYAVIALLANTIALRGINSIKEVGIFVVALYTSIIIMFIIQLLVLAVTKTNPGTFVKKSGNVLMLAFSSRSSLGVLPVTIETLTQTLGVSTSTANFVASFGTTAGMQGCAGVFPALLIVYVANISGVPIDFSLLVMSVIVVTIGSLGIAGIPGTATMAASVSLTGTGLGQFYQSINPIIAIDPILDMGRTFLNVSGSMVNAILVDKSLKSFDQEKYLDHSLEIESKDIEI